MPSKSHLALLPLLLSAISFTAHATPIITSSSSSELSSNENDNDRRASCPSVHIFGARETTASAGYGSAGTVVNLILNAYPGSTAEAIVYPACGGQSSCGSVSYASSVQQGTTAVASAVNAYYSSCPSTSLVLVGYSQVCVGSFFDGWWSGFLYPFFLFFSSSPPPPIKPDWGNWRLYICSIAMCFGIVANQPIWNQSPGRRDHRQCLLRRR